MTALPGGGRHTRGLAVLVLLLAAAGCGDDRDLTKGSSEPAGTGTSSRTATPLIIAELTRLGRTDLLSPAPDIPCNPPFVHGYKWAGGDFETLTKAMSWDGSIDGKRALDGGSLCYAAGPHKAFNPSVWCCK